jgi:Flp pilus assembly protein TadD
MKQPPKVISPPAGPAVSRARGPWRLAVVAGLALVVGAGWYGWRWYTAPVPPAVSLDNVEPAVVKAVQAARQQVVEQPRSAEAWGELGMTLEANGFYPQARVCYAQAEELDPQDRRWPYFLGILEIHSQPVEGLRHLRRAVELSDPEEIEPRLRLAEALVDLNQQKEAESLLRQLLAERPELHTVHLRLGLLAYQRGDLRGSLPFLLRASRGRTTQKRACRVLTQVFTRLGRTEEAAQARYGETLAADNVTWADALRRPIEDKGVGFTNRLNRAIAMQEQGRLQESLPLLRDLRRENPNDYHSCLHLGLVLIKLDEFDEAEIALRQALTLRPEMVKANFNLGIVLVGLADKKAKDSGKPELLVEGYRAAGPYFQEVIRLKPDHARAHFLLGEWHNREHREVEARKAYQIALKCQCDFPQALARLAGLLLGRGRDADALVHLHHALILSPEDWEGLRLLARVICRSTLWK